MKKYIIAHGDWYRTLGHERSAVLAESWGLLPCGSLDYDVLILTGGADVGDNPTRDETETNFIKDAKSRGKTIFGICRGFQLMLSLTGVDLVKHIPDVSTQIEHRTLTDNWKGQSSWHTNESGLLVNSRHHQGAFEAPGWEILDRSPDGLIEAAYRPNEYGVQWHPEHMEMVGTPALDWLKAELIEKGII